MKSLTILPFVKIFHFSNKDVFLGFNFGGEIFMNDVSNEFINEFSVSNNIQPTKHNPNEFRKLESLVHIILSEIEELDTKDFCTVENEINLLEEVQKYEIKLIKIALKQTDNIQIRAAKLLRINKNSLNAKISRYKI